MPEPALAQHISQVIQRLEDTLESLRHAQQEAWQLENANLALAEYARELEERADPMNDGLPLIDRLQGSDHADKPTR